MKRDEDGTNKIRKCGWIRKQKKKRKEKDKGEQTREREKNRINREIKGGEKQKWRFSWHSDGRISTIRE